MSKIVNKYIKDKWSVFFIASTLFYTEEVIP